VNATVDRVAGRISVVVPFFNAAAVLEEALRSAVAQTGAEAEIVAVDDGSTDQSLAIARGFAPGIRVLTGPNRGVSAARNRGIAESGGEWLIFLDADDLLTPGTLRRRLDMAKAVPADVVICDWQELVGRGDGAADGRTRAADMEALAGDPEIACATSFWATTAALMYRRPLVEAIGGFRDDLPVIQDARLLFDAAWHGARFVHSPHVGARYRVLPDSLSRTDPRRFWRDCLANGRQIEALWRGRAALSAGQSAALRDIYNGAAQSLFRALDPSFREALAALRAAGLPISRRNRLAELLSGLTGHHGAVRIAEGWTRSRRAVARMSRRSPIFLPPLPG
jgi:glycosyltransferase involved in cell wall biosynthesis